MEAVDMINLKMSKRVSNLSDKTQIEKGWSD